MRGILRLEILSVSGGEKTRGGRRRRKNNRRQIRGRDVEM